MFLVLKEQYMEQLYNYLPRELITFVLVTLFSLLIGLSQRRISLKREENKVTRTKVISSLGR